MTALFMSALVLLLAQGEPERAVGKSSKRLDVELMSLKGKAKELYGSDAPTMVTFVRKKPIDDMTKVGEVATGVIFKEAKDELFLDTDPCKGKMLAFHQPYGKQDAGTVPCGGKDVKKTTVTQN
jgi:hypothetical protein